MSSRRLAGCEFGASVTVAKRLELGDLIIMSKVIEQYQYPSGLFPAAPNKRTGYDKAWIRDNVYTTFGISEESAKKTFHALLDVLKKHENRIDEMIKSPTKDKMKSIHARYDPGTLEEIKEEWGNRQNDAIGLLLFKVKDYIRDENDKKTVQKLVDYLAAIEYWQDSDNGMWEEEPEIHASSIGACIAGLKAVKNTVNVPEVLIKKGEVALNMLLPRESKTKKVDMALLSLIYPYKIATESQRNAILKNVEQELVRKKGVIRYLGDEYYAKDDKEAEWPLGLIWLAIIYKDINDKKHQSYKERAGKTLKNEAVPELYYGGTDDHNQNVPLLWAQSFWNTTK